MGSTTITISDEAFKILKVQKSKGESFSDVILRTFPKGHPARVLAALEGRPPLDEETAKSIRRVIRNRRKPAVARDHPLSAREKAI
jgi:predicted CopG family antitoxin